MEEDYHKGFLQVLDELTESREATYPTFEKFYIQYQSIDKNPDYFIVVAETENKIVGTIRVFLEQKFTHQFKNVGHIEDFVVQKEYRNKQIGKELLYFAINICKLHNCYKIILSCNNYMMGYYTKVGFTHKNNEMSLYL